jgi:hypothetical protein
MYATGGASDFMCSGVQGDRVLIAVSRTLEPPHGAQTLAHNSIQEYVVKCHFYGKNYCNALLICLNRPPILGAP